MDLTVVVNHPKDTTADQTTGLLLAHAVQRGWGVALCGIGDLTLEADDRIVARVRALRDPTVPLEEVLPRLKAAPVDHRTLGEGHVVLLRTNPAREGQSAALHDAGLRMLVRAVADGALVLNDPAGLMRASSKLYLAMLPPAYRPATVVSRERAVLADFVRSRPGRCVLKPLQGTRGEGVFFIDAADPQNLSQILDVLLRDGFAMAQDWIPEGVGGDVRLLLVDGEPLQADGRIAAVRRVPGAGELRSNVAQGGRAVREDATPEVLAVGAAIGDQLRADGIFLAGLDVIGGKAVEINVFSPGGIGDAGAFLGVDFVTPVLDALAERARGVGLRP